MQYRNTAVLLLSLALAVYKSAGMLQRDKCVLQPPCFDLLSLERMAQHVSKNVPSADSENILLKSQTFDKIRNKKYLHSCVLGKIIDFYGNVLKYTQQNSGDQYNRNATLELISIMDRIRNCTNNVKGCEKLFQKATRQPILKAAFNLLFNGQDPYRTTTEQIAEVDMSPEEVSIYQLQKLIYASERLNDTNIQERAMDELKSLHHYIPGRGFRNTNG